MAQLAKYVKEMRKQFGLTQVDLPQACFMTLSAKS
jgi:hypothetical protein